MRGKDDGFRWELVPDSSTWGQYVPGRHTDLYLSTSSRFRSSPASDGLHWTDMPGSPKSFTACTTDYDRDHHLLYAPCLDQGLWRMRTH